MKKRILLYFHTNHISYLIDEPDQIPQLLKYENLAELSSLATNYEIYVIVPGEAVLLTIANLQKLTPQRIRQALPFALEEQLIDDIDNLHFAIGEYQPEVGFPVAIVSKKKMDIWLTELKHANIIPDFLIASPFALPCTPHYWHACIYDNMSVVRSGDYAGFVCDKENLNTYLELKYAEVEQKPVGIHIDNFSSSAIAIKFNSITLNEVKFSENQFLEQVAKSITKYPFINLLQGVYQNTQRTVTIKKIWIAAACFAFTWVGLAFFSKLGSFFILHHTLATSEQSINNIYKRNFPKASSIVAPGQRMEEKLKQLTAIANKNNFLSMLGIIGKNLPKSKSIQIHTLDFHDNQLILSVSTPNFDDLTLFTQALDHQGLSVKQQNASVNNSGVKANLLLRQGIL
ncbi:MAG: epsL [Gammaproteobacteria bacterium]|jgi:general secretion pathway protein L|nr:epsL [Gammaproteobacteria bacterium]